MISLKLHQVYRERHRHDYGDIIRWKVTSVHKNVAIVQNQAHLVELAVTTGSESDFLGRCELIQDSGENNAERK